MNRLILLVSINALLWGASCTPFQASQDAGRDAPTDTGPTDRDARDVPIEQPETDSASMCNGLAANVQTDPRNCGACGHDCGALANVRAGAAVECRAGTCWVPATGCADGFAHCTASGDDGCETSLSRPESCGSCTMRCGPAVPLCSSTGGTQTCVPSCSAPTPDTCGTSCVDLQSDVANCSMCGKTCSFPNADASCVKGVCTIGKCKGSFGDCTADPGCETPLTTAVNCGACGKSCAVSHGSAQCLAGGTCGPVSCDTGYGNCDTSNPDCETLLAAESCSNGKDDDCDGKIDCADPDCGNLTSCGADKFCSAGSCVTCQSLGRRLCGTSCVQGNCCADPDCANGFACLGNQCSTTQCQTGLRNCGTTCVSGNCCNDAECGACHVCTSNRCANAANGSACGSNSATCITNTLDKPDTCQAGTCQDNRSSCPVGTTCGGGGCRKMDGAACAANTDCANNLCRGPKFCAGGSNANCPCQTNNDCESSSCLEENKTCGGQFCTGYMCNGNPPSIKTCKVNCPGGGAFCMCTGENYTGNCFE